MATAMASRRRKDRGVFIDRQVGGERRIGSPGKIFVDRLAAATLGNPAMRPSSALLQATAALVAGALFIAAPTRIAGATPIGPEFQVNTYTTGDQRTFLYGRRNVGMDASGNFVVVWESAGQDGSGFGVVGSATTRAARRSAASSPSTRRRRATSSDRASPSGPPVASSSPGRARRTATSAALPRAVSTPRGRRSVRSSR
jgi:hypothetical protein